jgi:methionyl-tRNA formyltransferase
VRLAFLGTPGAAVPSLDALVRAGHDVAVVISRPDRRRGRGNDISASPVKAAALGWGLTVAEDLTALADLELDYGIVVAYGAMIPAAVLERTAMLNVHFSLLPRWRGAAPVQRAILAGDEVTGVGVISLEATLDTGPLHGERRTVIGAKTASELELELSHLGADLLIEVLGDPERLAHPRPQVGESTYAAKLSPETYHLSREMTRDYALRLVRLERAYVTVRSRRLRINSATPTGERAVPGSIVVHDGNVSLAVADGCLQLTSVQPEGSRPMSGAAWWAGARLEEGATWE